MPATRARITGRPAAIIAALITLLATALALTSCGTDPAPGPAAPATVRPVPGSPIPEILLEPRAVRRLGITTSPVGREPVTIGGHAGRYLVIPYSAVVYESNGSTWTYVSTSPGAYRRMPIAVREIDGDVAVLSSGPPAGTPVVTTGAMELLGTEYNISGEQ